MWIYHFVGSPPNPSVLQTAHKLNMSLFGESISLLVVFMKSTDSYESIYLQLMDDMLPNRIAGYSGYIVAIIPIIVVIYSVNTSLQYYSAICTSTCYTIHIHQLLQLGFKEHQGTNLQDLKPPLC